MHRHQPGHLSPSPVAVDVVHSTDQPRGFWKLGRVKEVLPGQDGQIRGAILQVAGKGRQARSLHCPIQLYPLEVSPVSKPPNEEDDPRLATVPADSDEDAHLGESDNALPNRRSRRAATLEARDKMLALALEED